MGEQVMMMRSIQVPVVGVFKVLLPLIAVLMICACAAMGTSGINLISLEEEWELGEQFEAELAEELDPYEDAKITEMGQRIVAETRKAELPWRFYVVEDETINAFNVPGGLVYVHSGLIEVASDTEIAAVIGHEIGHGVARHGTQRLTQQYGLAILAGAVLGEDPGTVQEIVAQIAAGGAIAQFSQAQEFEADELGVQYMHSAGYDANGMVTLLERFIEMRDRDPGRMEQLFATHPATEERLQRVREQVEGL
jgi:beta-barrel assembly-enhancing protease